MNVAQSQIAPPPPPRSSLPPPPALPSSQLDDVSSHNAVAQLSQSLSSFPSSSFTFTSTASLSDPESAGQFSLDLSLPLDLDSTTGPASLPSLMSAISELEHCVARLSLEANEARNLQRSLRSEMAVRQKSDHPQQKQLQNGAYGKGVSGGGGSAKKNGKKAAKYRSQDHSHETGSNAGPCQDCGEDHPQIEGYEGGGGDYDHESYQLDLEFQHQQLQRQANEVVAAANAANNGGNGGSGSGLGVKSWEDRELMKALESVSLLDKRADEYRERLKILKVSFLPLGPSR